MIGVASHSHQLYCELSLILLAGALHLGYGLRMLHLLLLGLIYMRHELIMLNVGVTHLVQTMFLINLLLFRCDNKLLILRGLASIIINVGGRGSLSIIFEGLFFYNVRFVRAVGFFSRDLLINSEFP